jgi:hypothetical protein
LRESGKERTYREAFLRFGATDEFRNGVRHPGRVFCKKSPEAVENKGSGCEKERKGRSRVRKRKEAKEIEEVEEWRSTRFDGDNTRKSTIDSVHLSIVNLKTMKSGK